MKPTYQILEFYLDIENLQIIYLSYNGFWKFESKLEKKYL